MHFLALILLLPVCCLAGVHNAAHNDQVAQFLQALVLAKPFCKACEVLHMVQPRHGEDDGLVIVLRKQPQKQSECYQQNAGRSPHHQNADADVGCSAECRQDVEPAE